MAHKAQRTRYTVVLHPKRGYNTCGHGDVHRRKWRGFKEFYSLPAALQWVNKVIESLNSRKRPWQSFQILQSKKWQTDTLIFAYLDHETFYFNSQTRSATAV